MDRGEWKELITEYIKKYRWAAIIILSGLLLMMIPNGMDTPESPAQEQTIQNTSLQQELEDLLEKLEGAGRVRVLLTPETGSETYYQTDTDENERLESRDKRTETVLISGTDRNETGLIRRVDPPVYLGAVILCQGSDKPQVKLAVVNAVSTATGLTSDKISVLKMK